MRKKTRWARDVEKLEVRSCLIEFPRVRHDFISALIPFLFTLSFDTFEEVCGTADPTLSEEPDHESSDGEHGIKSMAVGYMVNGGLRWTMFKKRLRF